MKPQLLLILPLLLVDILTFSEVAALMREPSDMAVAGGLLLLGLLIAVNIVATRYIISNYKS
ncbi:hypothetical protein [Pontibacter harenae]|uniref:hypothetical protein n=1 Tax=Pontibacter harenae TaxID=2894083 RepID=UPI001E46404D|nr:hypothetical protein [Pontibacter harenae]MCC9168790.1 hypothetical protein [Pontibacter harenae]